MWGSDTYSSQILEVIAGKYGDVSLTPMIPLRYISPSASPLPLNASKPRCVAGFVAIVWQFLGAFPVFSVLALAFPAVMPCGARKPAVTCLASEADQLVTFHA